MRSDALSTCIMRVRDNSQMPLWVYATPLLEDHAAVQVRSVVMDVWSTLNNETLKGFSFI